MKSRKHLKFIFVQKKKSISMDGQHKLLSKEYFSKNILKIIFNLNPKGSLKDKYIYQNTLNLLA